MEKKDELLRIFAGPIREMLGRAALNWDNVQEIRLRVGRPVFVVCGGEEYVLTEEGARRGNAGAAGQIAMSVGMANQITGNVRAAGRIAKRAGEAGRTPGQVETSDRAGAYQATPQDLRETLEYVSSHSLYAFEEEIRQGFITIQGGHRIGLAGKTVMDGRGVRTIKYISFLNVRLAHQVRGCADRIMPYLLENGQALHALFISPPRCGKTTLLRDVIRQMSDGRGFTVGVVDERSELAACWQGIPQNDLGARTDVLDCCPKAIGMMMLVRAMSPEVIAVDEIGGREDIDAMRYAMNCGCRVLATVHGDSLEDVARKPVLGEMVSEGMFDRYIVISSREGMGTVEEIRDGNGKCLHSENRAKSADRKEEQEGGRL